MAAAWMDNMRGTVGKVGMVMAVYACDVCADEGVVWVQPVEWALTMGTEGVRIGSALLLPPSEDAWGTDSADTYGAPQCARIVKAYNAFIVWNLKEREIVLV